jgi:hypothetical protein
MVHPGKGQSLKIILIERSLHNVKFYFNNLALSFETTSDIFGLFRGLKKYKFFEKINTLNFQITELQKN